MPNIDSRPGSVLDKYLESLKQYRGFAGDIVCHKTIGARKAVFADRGFSQKSHLSFLLKTLGISKLYSHQKKAVSMIQKGIHTVISTPTASGKSLVYNLPVIDTLMTDPNSRALYLFPLKALARDQLKTVDQMLDAVKIKNRYGLKLSAAAYDGDISAYQKGKIRKNPPNIILTNPEMLHLSMLAHHDLWETFFRNLKYVVIDEVHTYRGIMGSNMAWVFRRMHRICQMYGSAPVYVFCSATIANPGQLAQKLTGLDVQVVNTSGSPSGEKNVILMRGLEGAARTAIELIHAAVHRNLRTICYTQSRKITELIALWASGRSQSLQDKISAYRAGFLPEERRMIEEQLGTGELLAVVSTSALELGIDIGNLDICILVGYPGTIMSTWQRAGRVGRDGKSSALILVAHEDALDQYFINHPDVFFSMPPEKAVINPENPVILKKHLECAASELRLEKSEPFFNSSPVREAVYDLEVSCRLLKSFEGDCWYSSRKSPHREVNLRSASHSIQIFLENSRQHLGEIDRHRAFFETHEGAVYLHRGNTYVISRFDHEREIIEARPEKVNYYTRARSNKNTFILEQTDARTVGSTKVGFGRLKIIERVTGYEKKMVSKGKSLGIIPLDLPELEFETSGLWIEIPETARDWIESEYLHFMGGIHALEHAAIGIMPLMVMTDRNDLGGISMPYHPQVGRAAVFVYDGVPGGLGLTGQAFENCEQLLKNTFDVINVCECETGCPACVHSPKCGSGNRPIDKLSALKILEILLNTEHFDYTEFHAYESAPADISIEETAGTYGPENEIVREIPGKKSGDIRYGVLDIETRRSAEEVGGWRKARDMGVSCAVLYDSKTDQYQSYLQPEIPDLCRDLQKLDLVIGFNLIRFDYKVLSGLTDFDFYSLPTLDLLLKVQEKLGYRLSLNRLATQTLGTGKTADGLMALQWWKEGKIDEIISYCRQDVKVTKELYVYGRDNRFLVFKNKAGKKVRVPVDW